MGSDANMEDYGFEYSDEERKEQDVDIENQYYNSKELVETDPEGALEGFAEVVRMEPEKSDWGFKALKQTVKLYYRFGKYREMMESYREMLTYIKSAVTRNYSGKCINNIMDFVCRSESQNFDLLQEFYQATLKALEEAKNERLWFKTNLKLCKIWFDMGEYGRMNKILKALHKSCRKEDGTDDQQKETQLLEVYAIEIQMYTETKNNKKLKQLYQKALTIKSAIPRPRIMGIIHECGGKMHMAERQWAEAATDFFEAFKNYDEAGNQRRIQCLKYLVLANMLMESKVNPFDGQEAKPYKNDPEILAMTNLIAAYQRNDILEFEKILKSNRRTIMDDSFIRNYIVAAVVAPFRTALMRTTPSTSQSNVPEAATLAIGDGLSRKRKADKEEESAQKKGKRVTLNAPTVPYKPTRATICESLKFDPSKVSEATVKWILEVYGCLQNFALPMLSGIVPSRASWVKTCTPSDLANAKEAASDAHAKAAKLKSEAARLRAEVARKKEEIKELKNLTDNVISTIDQLEKRVKEMEVDLVAQDSDYTALKTKYIGVLGYARRLKERFEGHADGTDPDEPTWEDLDGASRDGTDRGGQS